VPWPDPGRSRGPPRVLRQLTRVRMTATRIDQAGLLDEGRALRALARSLLGVGGRLVVDADDVVQEGELAALRSGGAGVRSSAWLRGTVRNLARMLQRGEARRIRREQLVARDHADGTWDPAAIAVQTELTRDVVTAVQQLEEPFRTVVVLRFWNGLLPEAIAARLGVPRNTVRSRLQRGIERLRGRLDAKYGTRERWSAPLLLLARGRDVAGGAVAVVGLATVGVLMQAKMLVGAVVLAAAAFVWFSWPRADTVAAPTRVDDAVLAASGTAEPTNPAADSSAPQRVSVLGETVPAVADEGPFDPTPVLVPPWSPEFLVVDDDEMPVAGASITIWPGKKVERAADERQRLGGPRHAYEGRAESPRWTVVTDADGRARPTLDVEYVVAMASHAAFGDSREDVLWHTRVVETKLVVVTELAVRGIVLQPDATPAAGAQVTAMASGINFQAIARRPEPATSDAAGRFTMKVQRHGTWVFRAERDGQHTFYRRRTVTDDRMEIVLQFPGAIAVAGRVVDAIGRAIAEAEVKAWREPQRAAEPAEDDEQMLRTTTDAAGRFVLPVRSFARYQLLASAAGHAASEVVWTETTTANPQAELQLALQAMVPIRGRVVHEDGQPFAGVHIGAEAELGEHGTASRPGREDRFGNVPATPSAADGTFELAVHPGTTWTLRALPMASKPLLVRELRGVAGGANDVVVKITADDLVGCVVRGTVVSAVDGSAVSFGIELLSYGDSGPLLRGGSIRIDGNRFATEPLPVGRRFGLWVAPKAMRGNSRVMSSLSMTDVPPFETRAGGVDLEIRVEPWSQLPVRVLGPGDEPVRNACVGASTTSWFSQGRAPLHVDGMGRVTLPFLCRGVVRLTVTRGGSRIVHEQEVTITPGANPELVIRLPR